MCMIPQLKIGQPSLFPLHSWPLDKPAVPFLNRKQYEHTIIHKAPRTVNDDILHFNTQSSSQWDSFRHFAYQEQKQFYNGVTMEDVKGEKANTRNGIQGEHYRCNTWLNLETTENLIII